MTEPVFFTLEGDFRGFVQDAAGDGNYQPENLAISATVTITPLLDGIVRATSANPRPIAYLAAPTVAIIDPADGRLKIRTAGEAGNPDGFSFTPVRLLANSAYLELNPATPLFYRLTFTSVTFGGVRGNIPSWDVEAPSADVTINVVESAPQTGAIANGVTKIAPGGVRLDGDNIVFTFGGIDLADPIPSSVFAGPTGDTGPKGDTGNTGSTGAAATISVGTVSTGNAGSSASITNVGTSSAATLNFTIPRGDKGETGNTGETGSTGAAATVSIGTVTTVSPSSSASVTNIGTSTAAVFDISIPKGDVGSADASTWSTLDGKPAVVAAGATKADARTAIDAEYTGNKGNANGYASLDSAGKVPYTQLPASIMSYLGTWNATTNSPSLADGTGDAGDLYRVSVAGSRNLGAGSITYGVGDYVIYNGSTWEKSDSTDAVASVNGYTGVVSLTKSDVGLGSVDNTADTAKPISTATQTALDGKEPTISGGSTGQYWDGTKTWTTLNKSAVGLGNVDNTTDVGKPVSTATQTALDGKEASISAGTTGQYYRGDKSWQTLNKSAVGLGNVDNTADSAKTVSSAATATNLVASTSTVVQLGTVELGHASDTTLSRSAAGVLAVEGVDLVKTTDSRLTNSRTPTAAGQVADLSIVAFGANTARAASSYGDFPFGVKLQRAITFTSVTFRVATADASGSLVVELRKNGTQVSGTPTTIAYGSQVAGGTSTGTWAFASGDIITVYVTGVGGTPGKGLIADITGLTT